MSNLPEAADPAAPPPTWSVPLDRLDPNLFQPRTEMDEAKLAELAGGIREHGLLHPITVRRVAGGRFQVIGGHRRPEAYRCLLNDAQRKDDADCPPSHQCPCQTVIVAWPRHDHAEFPERPPPPAPA